MSKCEVICGVEEVSKKPLKPFDENVCDFLDYFSKELRHDSEARVYSDVMAFAFWIRKSNLHLHKEAFMRNQADVVRVGKGIVFHIAPSNVPVNSMFSYVFGLLAGNSNIVRISSKDFPQVECMCKVLERILARDNYDNIRQMTSIVRYERDKELTDTYSNKCNVRVIWGGDNTISEIRTSPIPARSTEITFADRYSFGILSVKALKQLSEKECRELAENFYNDTYLMDQNACSAPHLIFWDINDTETGDIQEQKEQFWNCVADAAGKYDLEDSKISEKFTLLCEKAAKMDCISSVKRYQDNLLYVCELDKLDENCCEECRGKFGMFYEMDIKTFDALRPLSDERVQTCAYYGVDPQKIRKWMVEQHFTGVDRFVPIGKTLDIDLIWDGYQLIDSMSRVMDVR